MLFSKRWIDHLDRSDHQRCVIWRDDGDSSDRSRLLFLDPVSQSPGRGSDQNAWPVQQYSLLYELFLHQKASLVVLTYGMPNYFQAKEPHHRASQPFCVGKVQFSFLHLLISNPIPNLLNICMRSTLFLKRTVTSFAWEVSVFLQGQ